jgi:hypothetical protein
VARDSAREATDCLTEPALEDGLTDDDALGDRPVDALEGGLIKGLELLGRTGALDGGLQLGFMLCPTATKEYKVRSGIKDESRSQ